MILIRRSIPIIASLIISVFLELLIIYPEYLLYFWLGLLATIALSLLAISKKELWLVRASFFISLLLFNSGMYFFLFFLSGETIRQTIIMATVFLNIVAWTQIFYYYFRTSKYQVNSLQNITNYLNLISFFTLTSVAFSLILYLAWPSWLISLGVFVVAAILTLQSMWVNKIELVKSWRFALVSGLINSEIFWAECFLPSSFLVNALIVTVAYYSIVNIGRYYFLDRLTKPVIVRYLIIGICVLVLTVVTARWI